MNLRRFDGHQNDRSRLINQLRYALLAVNWQKFRVPLHIQR